MGAFDNNLVLFPLKDAPQRAVIVPLAGRTNPMPFIKSLWNKWKLIAHKIVLFQSKVILTIFYFTLILPVGVIFTIFQDVLNIKNPLKSTWMRKIKLVETLEEMRQQS